MALIDLDARSDEYDYGTAKSRLNKALGFDLSDTDTQDAFQKFGGSTASKFTDSSLMPVFDYFNKRNQPAAPPATPPAPPLGPQGFTNIGNTKPPLGPKFDNNPPPQQVPAGWVPPPTTGPAPTVPQSSKSLIDSVMSAWAPTDLARGGAAATAPSPTGALPPVLGGWDATKWNDPNKHDPKYDVGRLLAKYPPTQAGLGQVIAEIQALYPGATRVGKDSVNIPGVGEVDLIYDVDSPNASWQWFTGNGAAPAGMSYQDALNKVQTAIGRSLTPQEIAAAFAKFGGSSADTFTEAGLAPVISYFGGKPGGTTGPTGTTPPPNPIVPGNTGVPGVPIDPASVYPGNLFNDPGTKLLEDTIKARLNELFAPVNDPSLKQLNELIAARIANLQKPVYSDGQEQVIRTKLFDNLEHDRQNEIQTAIERLAGLGHGKSSGTIVQGIDNVNRRFDSTRAQSENEFALSAIDAEQQRADQVLGLAGSMYDLSGGVTDQETARRREALSLISTLSDIPGQRLQLAEQAAGMDVNPASISDQILKLMTNSQTQTESAANRRGSLVTGIGQIVGSILAGQRRGTSGGTNPTYNYAGGG